MITRALMALSSFSLLSRLGLLTNSHLLMSHGHEEFDYMRGAAFTLYHAGHFGRARRQLALHRRTERLVTEALSGAIILRNRVMRCQVCHYLWHFDRTREDGWRDITASHWRYFPPIILSLDDIRATRHAQVALYKRVTLYYCRIFQIVSRVAYFTTTIIFLLFKKKCACWRRYARFPLSRFASFLPPRT